MKLLMLGAAGLFAGGTAYYMSDSPDFDRIVKKSPAQVYAAFSALAQQGTITPPGQPGKGPQLSFRVNKVQGQSIHYEIQIDRNPFVAVDLTFAPAGEGGAQTRMTAELDIDTASLGPELRTEGGVALAMLQERQLDAAFARFMENTVEDIEAGRPLRPLRTSDMGVYDASARMEADPRLRRARAEARQAAASRPATSARPMVDPNRAADRYLDGRNPGGSPSDDWGR